MSERLVNIYCMQRNSFGDLIFPSGADGALDAALRRLRETDAGVLIVDVRTGEEWFTTGLDWAAGLYGRVA